MGIDRLTLALCKYKLNYKLIDIGGAMGQVTIYMDSKVEDQMRAAAKSSHLSVSKWVSQVIQNNVATQWSTEVVDLAGSWRGDFPSLDDIRASGAADVKREVF
jgi:hypothetical protein